jgi:hypothetical protein
MNQEEFLAHVAHNLEKVGIPFMVAGSHSSSFHGQPRATNDVDIVIDPTPEQLDRFLGLFGEEYYVSQGAAKDALRHRSLFNIIHSPQAWKADLIIRKNRPFSVEEFGRRRMGVLYGHPMPVASPEDVILTKLEWNHLSPSERQVQDAFHVAMAQWANLDLAYLRAWAPQLGVAESLDKLLQKVQESLQPPGG